MAARLCALASALLFANVAVQGARLAGPPVTQTDPVGKVIELLDVLYKQLDENGKKDAAVYMAFDAANQKEVARLTTIIETEQAEADSLKAELEEQEALREAKKIELEKESNDLVKGEKDLQDSKDVRAAERKEFEKAEATLVDGVDSLGRSLVVLAKQQPAEGFVELGAASQPNSGSAHGQGAALISVAKNLRKTLEQGPDFSLSATERQTLDGFFRAAAERASNERQSAPDFMQVQSRSLGPYESQAGGVVETLQSVLDKANAELEEKRSTEATSLKDAEKFEKSLESQIATSKETITNLKTLLAQSQETSSVKEVQRQKALDILKTTTELKESAVAEKLAKTAAYEERVKERTEEALAVEEATRIMTSETAQRLLDKDDSAFAQTGASNIAPSLLQVKVHARHVLRHASTSGLALIALRVQTHLRRAGGSLDPFAKVREMVSQMLKKLMEEQAQDEKHSQWCDGEMAKSTKEHSEKTADVLKLKNRIGAAEVEIAQLTEDLATVQKDVSSMKEANAEATTIRQEEHAVATGALKNYKAAVALLEDALAVLKKFYGGFGDTMKGDGTQEAEGMQEHKTQWGLGGGVIAILEVAVEDYQKLYDDTKLSEDTASKEFKNMMNEAEVSLAKFEKDLEYKGNAKVKLSSSVMHMREDKKSYSDELDAVDEYIMKLKEQCIVKPDTYGERKRRREQELEGLKGALAALNSA